MSDERRWRPGEPILLREVWRGKVGSVRPVIAVLDSPEAIAVYTPAGSLGLFPTSSDGRFLRIPENNWSLKERVATVYHVLGIQVPGERSGTLLIWDWNWRLNCWYINLEEPFRRSKLGFDYMDLILDIVVAPDLSSWRWKDEDELQEAVARGIFNSEQAAELYLEGERALKRLLARAPPFDRAWEEWRPDPSWPVPTLPERLDRALE